MRYCGIEAVAQVVYPEKLASRFGQKTFSSYLAIAKKLKSGEVATVAVKSKKGFVQLLGYGEVTGIDKNGSYSVPRMLSHEY